MNDDLNTILFKGGIVTENIKTNASNSIKNFYRAKGYLDAEVRVEEIPDEKMVHAVRLVFDVTRNEKIKIQDITFAGNENVKSKKLRKKMDNTKRKRKISLLLSLSKTIMMMINNPSLRTTIQLVSGMLG